ncbi:MAG: orotidine-5'-phosphate decarboxylase [Candidatus Saccharibacteria bacterium]
MEAKDKILVALDVDNSESAYQLVKDLAPYVGGFKIGLELIMAIGAKAAIEIVHSYCADVFLDGKFCDISNTVGKASNVISDLGVKMFNVHASAGVEAMRAAVANKRGSLVLAVTVLTSLDQYDAQLIFGSSAEAKVLQFARDAKLAGCDGIVCSPQELMMLGKNKELSGLLKVVPGIRPKGSSKNDQERFMTPGQAIEAGADYLVIGRPITGDKSPVEAAKRIADEIQEELEVIKE